MALTETEQAYLEGCDHGWLATVGPNGMPQNKPVGFRYNPELGTIDIFGYNMGTPGPEHADHPYQPAPGYWMERASRQSRPAQPRRHGLAV